MGEKAASEKEYARFSGMTSTVDPHDIPSGQAVLQINLSVSRPGEANVRRGLKELTFETDD